MMYGRDAQPCRHQGLHPDSWVLGCEKKQDMVLLHHELEVFYDDGHICE